MKNKKNSKKRVFRKQIKRVSKRQNTKNQTNSSHRIDENDDSSFFSDLNSIFRNSNSENSIQTNEQQQREKTEDEAATEKITSQTTQNQVSSFQQIQNQSLFVIQHLNEIFQLIKMNQSKNNATDDQKSEKFENVTIINVESGKKVMTTIIFFETFVDKQIEIIPRRHIRRKRKRK